MTEYHRGATLSWTTTSLRNPLLYAYMKFQYTKIILEVLPSQALSIPGAHTSLQALFNSLLHFSFNLISTTHEAPQKLQDNLQSKQIC